MKSHEGLFGEGATFYFNFQGAVPQRASADLYQLHAWKALGNNMLIGHQSLVSRNIPARAIVLNNISKDQQRKTAPREKPGWRDSLGDYSSRKTGCSKRHFMEKSLLNNLKGANQVLVLLQLSHHLTIWQPLPLPSTSLTHPWYWTLSDAF